MNILLWMYAVNDHHHDGRKMVMVMETNEKKKVIIFEIGLVGLVTVELLL